MEPVGLRIRDLLLRTLRRGRTSTMNPSIVPVLGALVALAPVVLMGQHADGTQSGRRAPTRVPLTIALVQVLPHRSAPFEIQRRTSGEVRDVVLLPETATAEQLSDAIRGVLTARLVDGDTATHARTVRVRPRSTGIAQRPPFPWAHRVLADLRRAPAANGGGHRHCSGGQDLATASSASTTSYTTTEPLDGGITWLAGW